MEITGGLSILLHCVISLPDASHMIKGIFMRIFFVVCRISLTFYFFPKDLSVIPLKFQIVYMDLDNWATSPNQINQSSCPKVILIQIWILFACWVIFHAFVVVC